MQKLIDSLTAIGLTRNEAAVFAALAQNDVMNGYQISKLLGIQRPVVYDALESLHARSFIYKVPGNSMGYRAKNADELIDGISAEFEKNAAAARDGLKKLTVTKEDNFFINLKGYESIKAKLAEMINNAEREIYLSGDFQPKILEKEILAAKARNVRIIFFSFISLDVEGLDIELFTHGHPDDPSCPERRIMAVSDYCVSMIASSFKSPEWTGTFSENPLLSRIVSEHIHHDIYLLRLQKKNAPLIDERILLNTIMEKESNL